MCMRSMPDIVSMVAHVLRLITGKPEQLAQKPFSVDE